MSTEHQGAELGAEAGSEKVTSNAGDAEQLIALARATDAELAGAAAAVPGAPAAAEPAIPLEQELAGMFAMMGAGAGCFLPSVPGALNEQACTQLGDVLAPVARKYGLDRYLTGFAWRLELQALMVVAPIGAAIGQAVRHDLAAIEKRQGAAELGSSSPAPAAAAPIGAPAHTPGMLQPLGEGA